MKVMACPFLMASLIFSLMASLIGSRGYADVLQVPEMCFEKKMAPCLTQVQGRSSSLKIKSTTFTVTSNSILQWNNFDDLAVDILKGSFIVTDNTTPFKLNEIFISKPNQMIRRQDNLILGLDLKTFILSTYKVSEVRSNTVLLKTEFLEKMQLLKYASGFFERRKSYVQFLKSIEGLWKAEFVSQTKTQTKVLERAVASLGESLQLEGIEKQRQDDELKKVREQFFYRTFYR